MKTAWLSEKNFLPSAAVTAATLLGVMALSWGSAAIFAMPHGRWAATMISLARSRAVLYNPGVTGYYEQLLGTQTGAFSPDQSFRPSATADTVYDRSYRIYRFLPNLAGIRTPSQPQGITTNSFGFLGAEPALQEPAGTRRIALLGDSLAQGWGAAQNRSFERQLEDRLNSGAGPRRFEILNFAVTGYELTQLLDVEEKDVPRFHPDSYFLVLTELMAFRTWDEHLIHLIRLGIDPQYGFLRDAVQKSGALQSDDPLVLFAKLAPYRIPVLRSLLSRMKALAAQDRAPFLVALVPSLEDGEMSQKRLDGMPELLASLDIPFVDARDTFDGVLDKESLRINPLDVHLGIRGQAMLSARLYAKLQARPDIWAAFAGTTVVP